MLQELSSRLSKTIEQKRHKEKLERDLPAVAAELQDQSSQLGTLEAQLEKEKVDFQKLEQAGLTALFYAVLGSREAQLEKERREFLAAQLKYQQVKRQVEYLERERDYIQEQLAKLVGVEAKYEALLSEKEALLRQTDQALAGELVEYAEQIANLATEGKELSEAIQAGTGILASLKQVLDSLKSAKSWGAWDLVGGGLVSTALKHERIDAARDGIHAAQAQMSQFKREMADVQERVELEIDISEFETFADYFFDGLIFDWVVQSKIAESLERTQQAYSMITQAVEELEILNREAQSRQDVLEKNRAQLIARA